MPVSSNIIENTQTGTVSEKVRTFRVEIDTPFVGEKTIAFHCERKILLNDTTDLGTKPQPPVRRRFSEVQTELITITDPVTQQPVTVSVAGVGMAIADRYMAWYEADKAAEAARNNPAP